MIRPKIAKLTKAQETAAYDMATKRDDLGCVLCGRRDATQLDHRQNRDSRNTRIENLQTLCLWHHQWKTEHPDAANRNGYGVPRWAVPGIYPARRWVRTDVGTLRRAWVLYVSDIELFDVPLGYREITITDAQDRMAGFWGEVV